MTRTGGRRGRAGKRRGAADQAAAHKDERGGQCRPLPSSRRAFRGEVERGKVSLGDRLYVFSYFIKKTNSQYSELS